MFPDTWAALHFFFFTTGSNLRRFNDTVQNTSTVSFENLLQMCDTASMNTQTCARTHTHHRQRSEKIYSATGH